MSKIDDQLKFRIIKSYETYMQDIKCESFGCFYIVNVFHPNGYTIEVVGDTLTFIKANAYVSPESPTYDIKQINKFESWLLSGHAAEFNISVNGVIPKAITADELQAQKDAGALLKKEKIAAERLISQKLMDSAKNTPPLTSAALPAWSFMDFAKNTPPLKSAALPAWSWNAFPAANALVPSVPISHLELQTPMGKFEAGKSSIEGLTKQTDAMKTGTEKSAAADEQPLVEDELRNAFARLVAEKVAVNATVARLEAKVARLEAEKAFAVTTVARLEAEKTHLEAKTAVATVARLEAEKALTEKIRLEEFQTLKDMITRLEAGNDSLKKCLVKVMAGKPGRKHAVKKAKKSLRFP